MANLDLGVTMLKRPLNGCFVCETGREWYSDGRLHREDGPAFEGNDGVKKWYRNGLLHRVGGAAEIYPQGARAWLQDGLLHRTDGPALSYGGGSNCWYVRGRQFTRDEFYCYVDTITGEVFVPPGKILEYDNG